MSVENDLNISAQEARYPAAAAISVDLQKDGSLPGVFVGNADAVNMSVDIAFINLDPHVETLHAVRYCTICAVLNHDKGGFTHVCSSAA